MRTLILTIKGILLWVTTFVTMVYISGIDSITNNDYFLHRLAIVTGLIFICYKTISEEELKLLSGSTLFEKWTGIKLDEEDED